MPQDSRLPPSEEVIDVEHAEVPAHALMHRPSADMRHAHEGMAKDLARLAFDFTTERYLEPTTPMVKLWKPWTRRKGDGVRSYGDGRFTREATNEVRAELSQLPDDVKNQYLADILVETLAEARNDPIQRPFTEPAGSKERKREELIRNIGKGVLSANARRYVHALGTDVRLDDLVANGVVQPFRHFISPYLHVLEQNRILLNTKDQHGDPETVMIAPWRHKQMLIENAVERNTVHSAKYLHKIFKRHSIDNTLHLWIFDYMIHHARTHMLRDVPVLGLDQTRFAINRDHVDEYGIMTYPFKDRPDRITVMMQIANIMDDYDDSRRGRGTEGFRENVEYIAHKLGARGMHRLDDPSVIREMELTNITQDDLGDDSSMSLLNTPRGRSLLQMLNTLDNAAEFNMLYLDGPLSNRIPDEFSLSEGLRQKAREKMDPHVAYFMGPDKNWPSLRTRLNVDNGKVIWGGTHAVYSFVADGQKNLESIAEEYGDVLPFNPDTLKQFQSYINTTTRIINGIVRIMTFGKTKDAGEKLRDISLNTFRSEIPPNRIGGLLSEHRFALYGGLAIKAVDNVADRTKGSKFGVFRDELFETIKTQRWREFITDMIFYNPEETGRRIHGKIVVDQLPEAQAAMEFSARYRVTGNYLLEEADEVMRILQDRILIEPHNMHLHYAAATALLFTGQAEFAQRHFEALRDTLDDKDSLDRLPEADRRYAQQHLLSGSQYFLAHIMGKSRNPQEYLDTLRKGYKDAAFEIKDEMISRGGRPMRVRDTIETVISELHEDDPLKAMEAVLYAPYSIDARRRAVTTMEDRGRAKMLAYQTIIMISDLGDDLTAEDREKAKSFLYDAQHSGVQLTPDIERRMEHVLPGYKAVKQLMAEAKPIGAPERQKPTSDISDMIPDVKIPSIIEDFALENIPSYDPKNPESLRDFYQNNKNY